MEINIGDCILDEYDNVYEVQTIRFFGHKGCPIAQIYDGCAIKVQLLDIHMITGELKVEKMCQFVID